ncbi:MAG: hypothetical protein H7831_18850, partial [Magnetococcus sp. WYHC-3]
MYHEAFTKLDLAEAATILDIVNPAFDGTKFDPVETTIMTQQVRFYPGYRLLDIADHASKPALRRFVLYTPENFIVLNFTNAPIYSLNEKLPIKLNSENVDDYVRFFFSYVRGRHGRFIITESVEDIHWRDDPPPSARKAIGKMLNPESIRLISSLSCVRQRSERNQASNTAAAARPLLIV